MTYAESIPMGGQGRRGRRCHRGILMFAGKRRHGRDPFGFGGWGPGRGGPAAFFGGGRRAGRGDIRAAILALLSEQGMHGYQIIRELSERTGGAWQPSPGSVYPTLQQLEDEELVSEQKSDTGRRVYELTDAGRERAAALPSPAPWEQVAAEAQDEHADLRRPGVPGARGGAPGGRGGHARTGRGGVRGAPLRAAQPVPDPGRG